MLNDKDLSNINWDKVNGLIPCIVQDFISGEVLMHAYMNYKSLIETQKTKLVTFYSRTKKRLWVKGEKSKNFLNLLHIILDCDNDSLLILANPVGKTCHLDRKSCFFGKRTHFTDFFYLENLIKNKKNSSSKHSYTFNLHNEGINRIIQKVGEEAVEVIIAAMNKNNTDLINESSDLIYHLLILLHNKNLDFYDIIKNLIKRNK